MNSMKNFSVIKMKYKKIFVCGPYEILHSEDTKIFIVRADNGADKTYIMKTNSLFRAFKFVMEQLQNYTMISYSLIKKENESTETAEVETLRNPDFSVKSLAEKMWGGAEDGKL